MTDKPTADPAKTRPTFTVVQREHEFRIEGADDWEVDENGVHFFRDYSTEQARTIAFVSHPCVVMPQVQS